MKRYVLETQSFERYRATNSNYSKQDRNSSQSNREPDKVFSELLISGRNGKLQFCMRVLIYL